MIPINRETLMIAATIACVIGILFLFREMNKTKEEMDHVKKYITQKKAITIEPSKPIEEVPDAVLTPEKDITP